MPAHVTGVKCPPIPGYEPVRFLGWSCCLGGTIHIARRVNDGARVVLQVFPYGPADGPAGLHIAKARRLLRWRHPSVFEVVDVGRIGRQCYVATECVESSRSLDQRLESGRVSVQVALSTAHRVAAVLRDARSEDLICTRWGLGSIFLTDDDAAKLVAWDFEDRENLPPYGPLGSPAFTPPEWLAAEDSDVSPAADVYRVGCALYAMLTGRLPFVGESAVTVLHRILEGPPAPVRKVAPDVPEGVAALCMKCLARDSEERYPELGAFMLTLSSLMANRPPR